MLLKHRILSRVTIEYYYTFRTNTMRTRV